MTLPSYAMNQQSFPEMYERWLAGPLFRPWAEITLDEVQLTQGDRLLDIACGTGVVARAARERLGNAGSVVGIDISPDMLAVARAMAPDVDWREGSADALPLYDGELFNVVVCQQGLQFFSDKPAALLEMRRALANGGRLATTTWLSDDEVPFFGELRRIAERHLGPIADTRHSLGDAALIESLFREAGFNDVQVKKISRTIRFDDDAPLLRLNTMALVGMSESGKGMSDQERKEVVETIVNESAPMLQTYTVGSGLAFDLPVHLAKASKG